MGMVVILECGHSLNFSGNTYNPRHPSPFWCVRCEAYVMRDGDDKPEWYVKCENAHCRFARYMGQSQAEADRLASKHQRNYPTHPVSVDYISPPRGMANAQKRRRIPR